ncbi:hypothetical protein CDV31_005465 [Fusarium ambrosium]|uniref:2EXR domain-containing protein n=1 Tax=Fusarium ambrosium TaxID=131363 RepID=A0A428UJH1_9HYPO|nr:hypothetical protein CDV31_005465 [Fusarium ambrosium]
MITAVFVVNPTSLVMENMATEGAAPYLQLLNPRPKAKGEFHLFPQLPTDIRCMIWRQALCHERLVFVDLISRGTEYHGYWHRFSWVKPIPNNYVIYLFQRPNISKLFHVNAESRSCASRFYRVQLPCTYFCGGRVEENGTLYLNPELDTLAIWGYEHFIKFARDVWANDPKRVGLLNMAIPESRIWPMYTSQNKDHLREVVSRLQRVWFISMQEESAKLRRTRFRGTDDTIWKLKPDFSQPIMPTTPAFDRRPDPRPIQAGLRQVYIGHPDPRILIHDWICLVAALGVERDLDYRFVVTYGDQREQISNRDNAVRYIERQYEQWKERLRVPRKKVWQPAWLSLTIDETCQNVDQIPQPVMGFWLFPIECLGPLPPIRDPSVPYEGPWIYNGVNGNGQPARRHQPRADLSEYWPELCLSYLP